MAINKDNVLDASWNNESLLQIRTALQELLTALGDSIDAAAGGNPASINLSVEGTVLTATVTLADGETELSCSVDLAGAISAVQVAVEIINNLYTDDPSKTLSAAMGVQLDRMSGTVLKHLHWIPGAAHASLAVGDHARYFAPELGKIFHFYGYTPPGQGQPELGLDVYTPPAGVIFYDIETGSCYRFVGMDMVDILSSKANAADVVKGINASNGNALPKNGNGVVTLPAIQEPLQYDEQPTQDSTKMVKSGGIYTALQNLLSNISIGANGNWYIGQTNTNVPAKGDAGNVSITDAANLVTILVNDLITGGAGNLLSAEMGKKLRIKVDVLNTKVNDLINALANIAFVNGKPYAGEINWGDAGVTHHTVTLDTTGLDGCSVVETFPKRVADGDGVTITINPNSGILSSASYKIGVSGTSVNATIINNQAVISVSNITEDITIYVTAYSTSFTAGKKFSTANADTETSDQGWSVSNYIPANGTKKFIIDAGQEANGCYCCLYDSNKELIGQVELDRRYNVVDYTSETGILAAGISYLRICYPTANISKRFIYDFTNDMYLYKGIDYDDRYLDIIWGSAYESYGTQPATSTSIDDTVNDFVYCKMANYVTTSPDSTTKIEVKFGFLNPANTDSTHRRCVEILRPNNQQVYRIFANPANGDPYTFDAGSTLYNKIRGSFSIANLDDCYIFDVTNQKYIFRGLNNPKAGNDNS